MTTVAILGGTGAEGFGLALRWTHAGVPVVIGSRELQKAEDAAGRLRAQLPDAQISGAENAEAAAQADTVVLTVPLAGQVGTIKSVREHLRPGAVFVDATVPLGVALGDRLTHVINLWPGSAAQQAASWLPAHAAAVSAFHALSAVALADLRHPVECDVLVCGDKREAKDRVFELVRKISGARPLDGGALENSRFSEYAAALLIGLNQRYKVRHSGLRITGLPDAG